MSTKTIPLQPLTDADLDQILAWRNTPEVRRSMYTHHEITSEEHHAWFKSLQNDPTARWYLYRNTDNKPFGVVYFTDLDTVQKTACWGFYTKPDAVPGTGMRMLFAALELAFDELGLYKVNGEALASNTASIHLHRKFGFTQEGIFRDHHFDGEQRIDVIRFGLLANEWASQQERLCERIKQLDALATQRGSAAPWRIVILSDADSWINEYLIDLVIDWKELGHGVNWSHDATTIAAADFCFCLGFGQLISNKARKQFHHTLVVHESDLPLGKGWSPLTWQILEGRNRIPVTLIEAAESVDSGNIYAQHWLELEGHELIGEIRTSQADATMNLCRWFVDRYPDSTKHVKSQVGNETFYPRRRPEDSRLDPAQTLVEQFNLLRVVDNQRYPAFFEWMGQRYRLTISKDRAR